MSPAQTAVTRAWAQYLADRERHGETDASILAHYQATHPLWTTEMELLLPSEAVVSDKEDPTAYFQFVSPDGSVSWYVLAARPIAEDTDYAFLAYVVPRARPHDAEVGYVTLSELRAIRGPFLLNVELDRRFAPTPISVLEARAGGASR